MTGLCTCKRCTVTQKKGNIIFCTSDAQRRQNKCIGFSDDTQWVITCVLPFALRSTTSPMQRRSVEHIHRQTRAGEWGYWGLLLARSGFSGAIRKEQAAVQREENSSHQSSAGVKKKQKNPVAPRHRTSRPLDATLDLLSTSRLSLHSDSSKSLLDGGMDKGDKDLEEQWSIRPIYLKKKKKREHLSMKEWNIFGFL